MSDFFRAIVAQINTDVCGDPYTIACVYDPSEYTIHSNSLPYKSMYVICRLHFKAEHAQLIIAVCSEYPTTFDATRVPKMIASVISREPTRYQTKQTPLSMLSGHAEYRIIYNFEYADPNFYDNLLSTLAVAATLQLESICETLV